MTDETKDPRALIADGRKHDEAMDEPPWRVDDEGSDPRICDGQCGEGNPGTSHPDCGSVAREVTTTRNADGIAWMRTNLRALLDGYEAALDRVGMLQQHITEANANAPYALVNALESLTRRSVELDLCNRENERLVARIAATDSPADIEQTLECLKQAGETIGRLKGELSHATAHDGDHLSKASRLMVETVMGDRDRLRADVIRLTETARAASENWMEACRQRDEARAETDQLAEALQNVVSAYRASKETK